MICNTFILPNIKAVKWADRMVALMVAFLLTYMGITAAYYL